MNDAGYLLVLGMMLLSKPALVIGHVQETMQPVDRRHNILCFTVGETNSERALYRAEGFGPLDFQNETNFEIFLDKNLVGAITTTKQGKIFSHTKHSLLSSYPEYDKTFSFGFTEMGYEGSYVGFNFIFEANFKDVPATFNGITFDVSFTTRKLQTTRSGVFTVPWPLPVRECERPKDFEGEPKSCEYGCKATFTCPFNGESFEATCGEGCQFKPEKYCYTTNLQKANIGDIAGPLIGIVIIGVIVAVIAAYRLKTGKWLWARFSKDQARKEIPQDDVPSPVAAHNE